MSLIVGDELLELVHSGVIDALPENIGASSVDVRLGSTFLMEVPGISDTIDLAAKALPRMQEKRLGFYESHTLVPGDFCLAHTIEVFNLPDDISAEFKLRSSCARAGLQHALAGWCDAGWNGAQLTLELSNSLRWHSLVLKPGMRIGQIIFYHHAAVGERSYAVRGRYNGTIGVSRDSV